MTAIGVNMTDRQAVIGWEKIRPTHASSLAAQRSAAANPVWTLRDEIIDLRCERIENEQASFALAVAIDDLAVVARAIEQGCSPDSLDGVFHHAWQQVNFAREQYQYHPALSRMIAAVTQTKLMAAQALAEIG